MLYYSLSDIDTKVSFKDACLLGQSPEGGLFYPSYIPTWDKDLLFAKKDDICSAGTEVLFPYVCGEQDPTAISKNQLYDIVSKTLSFPIPLVTIHPKVHVLELFHGPTMAFKDVGATFLSLCLSHYAASIAKEITVLVATSGDTGGAVANAFSGIRGVRVVILYPVGKVSPLQEKQLCDPAENVFTLKVRGTFDDCQSLVKQAFRDKAIQQSIYLTSANSINVARWISQQLYYVKAFYDWGKESLPSMCVPSGNFGNLCAGMLANQSGLPVQHFIAACNANDCVPTFLNGNQPFQTKPAVQTLSNAMDIGSPNNFVRLQQLFDNNKAALQKHLSSYRVSDEETKSTIKEVYEQYGYILEPHGAVAYHALMQHQKQHTSPAEGIILATAHPIKFAESVEEILGIKLPVPPAAQHIMERKINSIPLDADYTKFKDWIFNNLS